jgi:hypothetical protein
MKVTPLASTCDKNDCPTICELGYRTCGGGLVRNEIAANAQPVTAPPRSQNPVTGFPVKKLTTPAIHRPQPPMLHTISKTARLH